MRWSGNVLTAEAGAGNTVFTFSLNATTGAWAFNLEDQLDHPTLDGLPGDNTENDLTILLGSLIQATDWDGDTVTANAGGLVVTVNDDTPIRTGPISSGTVDEDGVFEGARTRVLATGSWWAWRLCRPEHGWRQRRNDGDRHDCGSASVPVWCGRAADLFAGDGYDRSGSAESDVWRRCADLCGGRATC